MPAEQLQTRINKIDYNEPILRRQDGFHNRSDIAIKKLNNTIKKQFHAELFFIKTRNYFLYHRTIRLTAARASSIYMEKYCFLHAQIDKLQIDS
ncbi:MAG: hypothetical protein QM689_11260 [Oscillospiraceae bacterium]